MLSMKSSVALTTSGSALGRGKPVAEDEFAILIISDAGNLARDEIVCVVNAEELLGVSGMGDAAADGPRDDMSGVRGLASIGAIFRAWGVTGGSAFAGGS